jgi:hypothetical protein
MNHDEPVSARELAVLREFVDALDRRLAHIERAGEARIAREAPALRTEALNRIQELTTAPCDHDTREAARSEAVMADDGGPLENKERIHP